MSITTEDLKMLLSEVGACCTYIAWEDGRTIGIEENGEPYAIAEIVDHGDMADEEQLRAEQHLIALAPDLAKRVIAAEKLVESLRFYANPAIYEPHPHGPAFDRMDVSFSARAALSEWEAGNG